MTTEERFAILEAELSAAKRLIRRLIFVAYIFLGIFVLFAFFYTITDVSYGQSFKQLLKGAKKFNERVEKYKKLQGEEHDPSKWSVIKANQFILEDEQGRQRATIILTKYGPGLYLYDIKGEPLIALCSEDGEAHDLYIWR
jgi:hypothetical protein